MSYEVSIPEFTGPFDLLLHLITREEVDIYEVSLIGIVDAYLARVEHVEHLDLEGATEFLLIAATLVELKARRLLPEHSELDLDEELLLYEQRDLLLARLLVCKTFKDAAATLATMRETAGDSVPRTSGPEEPFASMAPDPLEHLSVEHLRDAAERAFTPKPIARISFHHVAPIRLTVREAVGQVLRLLPRRGGTTFRQLTAGVRERLEVIVRFLAVLELYKRGVVDIAQHANFGELTVILVVDPATGQVDLAGLEEWGEPAIGEAATGEDQADDAVAVGVAVGAASRPEAG